MVIKAAPLLAQDECSPSSGPSVMISSLFVRNSCSSYTYSALGEKARGVGGVLLVAREQEQHKRC